MKADSLTERADRTLSEVRRISAGGKPKKTRRKLVETSNAEIWKANEQVLILLGELK